MTDVEAYGKQMREGSNPGEAVLLGLGGPLDLGEAELAEVHQVLAEWL
jgi:hypothetical protein